MIETMDAALKILHSQDFPLFVRLGLFHYFFAYIHPFYDGNGRTDRFITSYFLKKNFHLLLRLRLSVYIKRNRKAYYKLFEEADSEINRGDLTPFLQEFLRILLGTIEDTIGVLKRKKDPFIPMYVAGYTMNMMTTLGLAISTGVLVNNSILIIENISRYEDLGHCPEEAARIGTKEIAIAILSSTATNLGVFIPIAFAINSKPGVLASSTDLTQTILDTISWRLERDGGPNEEASAI